MEGCEGCEDQLLVMVDSLIIPARGAAGGEQTGALFLLFNSNFFV